MGLKTLPPVNITGFVTRKVNYSESDLILTLFTKEMGKIEVIARGGRKSKKRFQGGISYYMLYKGTVLPKRGEGLWLLKDFIIEKDFSSLLLDFTKISAAATGTELIREITPLHQAEPALFALLEKFFNNLENCNFINELSIQFQYRVLKESGFIPDMENCTTCGKIPDNSEELWAISPYNGHFYCSSCGSKGFSYFPLKHLYFLTSDELLTRKNQYIKLINPVIKTLVQNIIGKRLKSYSLS